MLISGEPGIGKSRLTAALSELIGTEDRSRLRYFCSPHHQDSALYPFIGHSSAPPVRPRRHGRSEARQTASLARAGSRGMTTISRCCRAVVAASPLPASTSARSANARSCSRRCSASSKRARRRPVLMVFEDAHWIDPTSRELLDLIVDRVRRLPVLLSITFRPEFQPPWGGRPMSRVWRSIGSASATARRWCKSWPATPRSPPRSSPRSSSEPTGCRCLSRS